MIVRDLIRLLIDQDLDAEARIELPGPLHVGLAIASIKPTGVVMGIPTVSVFPTEGAMERLMERVQYSERVYHHGSDSCDVCGVCGFTSKVGNVVYHSNGKRVLCSDCNRQKSDSQKDQTAP